MYIIIPSLVPLKGANLVGIELLDIEPARRKRARSLVIVLVIAELVEIEG